MTWFKVDDKLAFHGKTLQAGNAAMGAWVRIGAWCSEHETDGAVPAQIASIIATSEELENLIGVGFLEALSGGGFKMHDYLVYNPSHAQLIEDRKKWASKKQRQRAESRGDEAESPPGTPPGIPGRDGSLSGSGSESRSDLPDRSAKSRGTRLPEDWDPPTGEHGHSWREVARKRGLSTSDVSQALEAFKDHWRAAAGQRGVKLDWDATWRNWLRSTRPSQQHTSGFRNGRDMGRPLPAEGYDWDAHERREKAEQAKAPIEVMAPAIGVRTEKRNAQPAAANVLSELMSKIGGGAVKPAREGAIGGATAEERALASRVALANMGGGK